MLAAAGIDVASDGGGRRPARRPHLDAAHRRRAARRRLVLAEPRSRRRSIEADTLNGEIVLLGRLHGVPTPVNELLQRVAHDLVSSGAPPGSLAIEDLEAQAELSRPA